MNLLLFIILFFSTVLHPAKSVQFQEKNDCRYFNQDNSSASFVDEVQEPLVEPVGALRIKVLKMKQFVCGSKIIIQGYFEHDLFNNHTAGHVLRSFHEKGMVNHFKRIYGRQTQFLLLKNGEPVSDLDISITRNDDLSIFIKK